MFIGHFAVGFAAKRAAPQGSLPAYFAAAQLPDLLWPVLLLAGVEHVTIAPGDTAFTPLRFDSYPISHSLLMDVVWAVLFGAVVAWRTRARRAGVVAALLVVSHWVLDVITHRPDMPLWPGRGPKLGLGLWNSVPATLVVETLLFAGGVWIYARATAARSRAGRVALGTLVAVLLVAYASASFGPPPPGVPAIALTAFIGIALFLLLARWIERTRTP